MKLTGLKDLQIDVPRAHYKDLYIYFAPKEIRHWIQSQGLEYLYAGESSSGNGYDENGVSNKISHYVIKGCQEEDASAFAILFPHCKVHVFDNYAHTQ